MFRRISWMKSHRDIQDVPGIDPVPANLSANFDGEFFGLGFSGISGRPKNSHAQNSRPNSSPFLSNFTFPNPKMFHLDFLLHFYSIFRFNISQFPFETVALGVDIPIEQGKAQRDHNWPHHRDCPQIGQNKFNCVHTRCIVKTSGFTRGVCKNRVFLLNLKVFLWNS